MRCGRPGGRRWSSPAPGRTPELYREYAGKPLMAGAEALTHGIGATELWVPGYYPHTQQPAPVNTALTELWAGAERSAPLR